MREPGGWCGRLTGQAAGAAPADAAALLPRPPARTSRAVQDRLV